MSVTHCLHKTRKLQTVHPVECDRAVQPISLDGAVPPCELQKLTPLMDRRTPSFRTHLVSISQPLYQMLKQGPRCFFEIGRFARAINMRAVTSQEPALMTLVTPEVGNGPFNIVVAALPPALSGQGRVSWQEQTLKIGPWEFDAQPAPAIWDPRPRWSDLDISETGFQALCARVCREIAACNRKSLTLDTMYHKLAMTLSEFVDALEAENITAMQASATALAGLGAGLTPAGDDMLAGAILALWAVRHPRLTQLTQVIYAAAAPHTTILSRAFLAAAARGETTEAWQQLLAALEARTPGDVERASACVLSYGATSGLDMLRGFVGTYARLTPA